MCKSSFETNLLNPQPRTLLPLCSSCMTIPEATLSVSLCILQSEFASLPFLHSFMSLKLLSSLISFSLSLSFSLNPCTSSLSSFRPLKSTYFSPCQPLSCPNLNSGIFSIPNSLSQTSRVSSSPLSAAIVNNGECEFIINCKTRASCGKARSPPPTTGIRPGFPLVMRRGYLHLWEDDCALRT